jgi:cell division protein FtsX
MKNAVNKIKWAVGLLFVFFLILATNLLDRRHIEGVRNSVSTMYEDRLVVKNLIYNVSTLTEEKRIAFLLSDADFYIKKSTVINDSIYTLLDKFSNTSLTYNEKKYLERLRNDFKNIEIIEKQPLNDSSIVKNPEWRNKMETQLSYLRKNLDRLAIIQVEEGKRELVRVNRAFSTIDLFTNIEIMFLIVIGLIVQIIILYPVKK